MTVTTDPEHGPERWDPFAEYRAGRRGTRAVRAQAADALANANELAADRPTAQQGHDAMNALLATGGRRLRLPWQAAAGRTRWNAETGEHEPVDDDDPDTAA